MKLLTRPGWTSDLTFTVLLRLAAGMGLGFLVGVHPVKAAIIGLLASLVTFQSGAE